MPAAGKWAAVLKANVDSKTKCNIEEATLV